MEVWEEHDRDFHYTTNDGLQGILETQSFFATHYKYMNDTTELEYLMPKLKEITLPGVLAAVQAEANRTPRLAAFIAKRGGVEKFITREVGTMIDVLYRVTFGEGREHKFLQPFLACFCFHQEGSYERQNGLLSQWRGYGRDVGYAIEFDTKHLVDLMFQEIANHFYGHLALGTVVYKGDVEAFNKEFKEFIDLAKDYFPKMPFGEQRSFDALFGPFASCASRYKHPAFSEESEVRLCLSPLAKSLVATNASRSGSRGGLYISAVAQLIIPRRPTLTRAMPSVVCASSFRPSPRLRSSSVGSNVLELEHFSLVWSLLKCLAAKGASVATPGAPFLRPLSRRSLLLLGSFPPLFGVYAQLTDVGVGAKVLRPSGALWSGTEHGPLSVLDGALTPV